MQSGQCCRCNGKGTCVRCDCTKAARKCWSCLPSRKDRCKNSATTAEESHPDSSDHRPVQDADHDIDTDSQSAHLLATLDAGDSQPPSTANTDAGTTASTITSQEVSPTTPDTAEVPTIPDLPPYPPLRDPSLTMGAQDADEFSQSGVRGVYMRISLISPQTCWRCPWETLAGRSSAC